MFRTNFCGPKDVRAIEVRLLFAKNVPEHFKFLNSALVKPIRSRYKKEYYNVLFQLIYHVCLSVCVEVLRPSQPNGVMSSVVSLPNHTFTGQA